LGDAEEDVQSGLSWRVTGIVGVLLNKWQGRDDMFDCLKGGTAGKLWGLMKAEPRRVGTDERVTDDQMNESREELFLMPWMTEERAALYGVGWEAGTNTNNCRMTLSFQHLLAVLYGNSHSR
jgi:hypothetical protein